MEGRCHRLIDYSAARLSDLAVMDIFLYLN